MKEKDHQLIEQNIAARFNQHTAIKGTPLPVYTALGDAESPSLMNAVAIRAYRYRVSVDRVGEATVDLGHDKATFRAIARNRFVGQLDAALAVAGQAGTLGDASEIRIFEIPSHHVMALWVAKEDGQDVFIPLDREPLSVDPDFVANVNQIAKQRRESYESAARRFPRAIGEPPLGG